MKLVITLLIANLFFASTAHARNSVGDYWINEVMTTNDAKVALGDSMLFFFGNEQHGKVLQKLGEIRTNKKTNAFNKSDLEACQWVFLSAMKALKARAIEMGGNAIVNIKSNYKDNLTSSDDTFKCGAGNIVAGVALVGTVVRIEQ